MELRKDYILDRYVIVSEIRAFRPEFYKNIILSTKSSDETVVCAFCPGNEYLTTKEKGRVGDPWSIRWFDNKYPAVEPVGKQYIQTDNNYFAFSDAYGYHEVIAETNDHEKQLYDFTDLEIKNL